MVSTKRRVAASLSLVAALLAVAAGAAQDDAAGEAWELELAPPEPVNPLEPIEDLGSLSCRGCHETIADEWAVTLHAHAWVDELYQEALKDKRRPQSCHGSHIPKPHHEMPAERFGRKPPPRTEEEGKLVHGITCRSCHGGPDGTILGPWGAPTDAHESVKSEHFVETGSNALCIACHRTTIGPVIGIAKDFDLARLEERGMSCVGCHMHPVERPAATDDDDNPTAVRPGRSHLLQTPRDPAFLAKSFGLSARNVAGKTSLTIKNRAGHRVPGLVDRRIVLTAEALDGAGAVISTVEHTIDATAYLPLEESIDLRFDAEAARVRVTGLHHMPGREEPVPFLDVTLDVE